MKPIPLEEIIGKRYGRLVALKEVERIKKRRVFLFQCDCGNQKAIPLGAVMSGQTSSCKCLFTETRPDGKIFKTHGNYNSREYRSWRSMWTRCRNPNYHGYANYGGRGIRVCDRWKDFANFLADMGSRPEKHSIDRIDPDGNYEPANCRWADDATQSKNKRKANKT